MLRNNYRHNEHSLHSVCGTLLVLSIAGSPATPHYSARYHRHEAGLLRSIAFVGCVGCFVRWFVCYFVNFCWAGYLENGWYVI